MDFYRGFFFKDHLRYNTGFLKTVSIKDHRGFFKNFVKDNLSNNRDHRGFLMIFFKDYLSYSCVFQGFRGFFKDLLSYRHGVLKYIFQGLILLSWISKLIFLQGPSDL